MSHQPPQDPSQSAWGAQPQGPPQAPQYGQPQAPYPPVAPYQPEPPKKKSWIARHKVLTVIGAIVAVFIIGGIASGGGDDTGSDTAKTAPDKAADAKPADDSAKEKPADEPKKELSQADQFKEFVAKNGSGPEKAAVKHVTKIQGAGEQNDLLDAADIYTDYEGGIMSPNQGDAKLLASAFADWKDSKNGLVTVYDEAGELMANGNF